VGCTRGGSPDPTPPPRCSVYCPAGCKDIEGDIWGNVRQGYRDVRRAPRSPHGVTPGGVPSAWLPPVTSVLPPAEGRGQAQPPAWRGPGGSDPPPPHPRGSPQTSVLCKAAVHAGVIADETGGQVTLSQEKGITLYESAFANGLHSKRWVRGLPPHPTPGGGARFSSPKSRSSPRRPSLPSLPAGAPCRRSVSCSTKPAATPWRWPPSTPRPGGRRWTSWGRSGAGRPSGRPWAPPAPPGRPNPAPRPPGWSWTWAPAGTSQVFEGNVDGHGEVSNAFIPPIVTRYLRVTPRSWHQRVAMKVALLGCQLARARAPQPYAPGGPEEIPLPVPTGRTPVPGVALDPEKAGSTLLVMLLVGGFVLLCSSLLLLAFLCRRRRKPAAELNCGLAKGYPKLESSPGCSLGSLPPPGSTPPSFPVAAPLGDLSQPPSPGNGDAGVWMGPTAWRGGRTNLCTPTLHPGEPSQPPPTLVQPPSCILNPLQREKSLRLIHGWYWRAPGSPRAVLSPWGGCPALPGEVLTAPGGRAGALSPPVTTHLSPPPHGAGGGSGL
uniref:Uncharacterized protein n=1 Tax=Anser cygnoides TaxID=8845 RepID=A0A8B9IES7_ANSCY